MARCPRWSGEAGGKPDAMTSASSSNGSCCSCHMPLMGALQWRRRSLDLRACSMRTTHTHRHTCAQLVSTHVLSYSHYSCSCRKLQATFTFVPILFLFRLFNFAGASSRTSERQRQAGAGVGAAEAGRKSIGSLTAAANWQHLS